MSYSHLIFLWLFKRLLWICFACEQKPSCSLSHTGKYLENCVWSYAFSQLKPTTQWGLGRGHRRQHVMSKYCELHVVSVLLLSFEKHWCIHCINDKNSFGFSCHFLPENLDSPSNADRFLTSVSGPLNAWLPCFQVSEYTCTVVCAAEIFAHVCVSEKVGYRSAQGLRIANRCPGMFGFQVISASVIELYLVGSEELHFTCECLLCTARHRKLGYTFGVCIRAWLVSVRCVYSFVCLIWCDGSLFGRSPAVDTYWWLSSIALFLNDRLCSLVS